MLLGKTLRSQCHTPTGLSPSTARLSNRFNFHTDFLLRNPPADELESSHNPDPATPAGYHMHTVWPHPISLATTLGITVVFSSCRY